MIAKERLENGAGGVETARLLSAVTDEVIRCLYDFTTVHVIRARNPTEGERMALMAVGGYGRGALAPFSDIDLLFVRPYKETPHIESVIEFMLYALWDLGFKVGHASRTVGDCIKIAREDISVRTSILEARRLTGDEALAADLQRRFREEVVKGTGAAFVAAKLKERDERHARVGASRFLVEPNVKEGKGGLRDLHTLFWIAQYLHPGRRAGGGSAPGHVRRPRGARVPARLRLPGGGARPPALRHRPAGGAADVRCPAGDRPADGLSRPAAQRRRQHPGGGALHAPLLPDRQGGGRR